MLTGFEAFKFMYFNKINRYNFETLSKLFISSDQSEDMIRPNSIFELNENNLDMDDEQVQIYKNFVNSIDQILNNK